MNKKHILLVWLLSCVTAVQAQLVKTTDIVAHDPVMMEENGTYYLFSTGHGITVWSSTDLENWKQEKPVFSEGPKWAVDTIPNFKDHIWAPDIYKHKGTYYLYYSVSAFGKNTSAIGVATNKTLDPTSPKFKWVDHGRVIQSYPDVTNWNAIDANIIDDEKGNAYMTFGSFWDGLQLIRLSKDRLSVAEDIATMKTIVSRKKNPTDPNPPSIDDNPVDAGGNAVEAPFIFKKGNYYYMFASIDYCCKGVRSSYKMIVGRSEKVTGPYLDDQGQDMARGGGKILLQGDMRWHGVGHNAVVEAQGKDLLIFHGYDAQDGGKPKLRIEELVWDENGWPGVNVKLEASGNPLFTHKYTADPAAMVVDDTFYLYAGEDNGDGSGYNIPNWLVFSSNDLKNWTEHPMPLRSSDFKWSKDHSAWASHVTERNGKYYWYVSTEHNGENGKAGKAIGVAVADSPTGLFKDAVGAALITNDMTTKWTDISWDDIDPAVFIDDDGQAYLFWGNTQCYYIKLKENMIETEGEIIPVELPKFTEAPWIHKRDGWYYLSYATEFPEKLAYAMSRSIEGPWEYKGILNEIAGNSNTNHQAILEFNGEWYVVYHNGAINHGGGSYRRSVCIDRLYYNEDGTMKRMLMTSEGVQLPTSR